MDKYKKTLILSIKLTKATKLNLCKILKNFNINITTIKTFDKFIDLFSIINHNKQAPDFEHKIIIILLKYQH